MADEKLTIEELEQLLNRETSWDDDATIEILPNGEIRAKNGSPSNIKPLTYKENLGGEYAR